MAKLVNNTVAIETALEGCPDPTASRAIVISAGYTNRVCHQFRNDDGSPMDLGDIYFLDEDDYDEEEGTTTTVAPPTTPHKVYIADALCTGVPVVADMCISGEDPTRVCFTIPDSVANHPGIYRAEMVVMNNDGNPYVTDSTLISVESSLYLRSTMPGVAAVGPITIGQVRIAMRDFAGLNAYWANVEFSDAEIVQSILEPISCFNETAPHAARYSPSNFPFRHHWLQAVCANLLRISAMNYMRNSRKIVFGDGKTSDDRDKYSTYIQMAEAKWREYVDFCVMQQVRINWGSVVRVGGYYQS